MGFYSGVANDYGQLATALRNACVAEGWTLSGSVVHKGAAYVSITASGADLQVRGGTGIDGGNALTGASPVIGYIKDIGPQAVTFPLDYEIHVHGSPDEVYLLANYNVEYWQWAAFGVSDVAGLPGTGTWVGASAHGGTVTNGVYLTPTEGGWQGNNLAGPAMFFDAGSPYGNSYIASTIHHGFDGGGWSAYNVPPNLNQAHVGKPAAPRYARQPSTVNAAAALLDFKIWVSRTDAKNSLAADLANARLVRIDNYDPGETLTLGSDTWRVYPWFRKNADPSARDGGYSIQHSGTLGWAIRYDGP